MTTGWEEGRANEGDQAEERFSTGGLDFKQALRQVLAGGREDEQTEAPVEDDEMTDEEIAALVEATWTGVANGTLPLFRDAASLREDIRRRFNR